MNNRLGLDSIEGEVLGLHSIDGEVLLDSIDGEVLDSIDDRVLMRLNFLENEVFCQDWIILIFNA